MKVLFIGDIFGKIGRKAVAQIVPYWRKKYAPDFVIGNNENLAHGVGITEKTVREVLDAGFDALTGGNHTFKAEGMKLLAEESWPLLRPANYPPGLPGKGDRIITSAGGAHRLLLINLIGRAFFKENFDDPFRVLDALLEQHRQEKYDGILVDFHAEATSEANALGHYADGRVSAILGTHTHIGTTDARLLPKGTAYVTDVGGVIAVESILGENKENIIQSFLFQQPFTHEPVEQGLCNVGAVLVEINEPTGLAKKITRLDEQLLIE